MELKQVSRKKAKIKLALQGSAGSGKTYSALLLAFGLCGDYSNVAVIDTENHSADLYAHLGKYNVLNLSEPYTPEKYIEAIHFCENAGMEIIILDSISHEWNGSGGILEIHSNMTGNSFFNWNTLTPRHNNFVQTILQSKCHIIGTVRTKQDYVINEKDGKHVPEKVGLKGLTRDGMDYEFTLVFDIDIKHNATASKDRTSLFMGKPEFIITADTGKAILDWCNSGEENKPVIIDEQTLKTKIEACKSYEELLALYKQYPTQESRLLSLFSAKRSALQPNFTNNIINSKPSSNGSTNNI